MSEPAPPREAGEATPLEALYKRRFSDAERSAKNQVWQVLCTNFFSRYISPDATVLDIGAGYCEFINHISAKRRIALDANPDVTRLAAPSVEAICASVDNIHLLPEESIDVVFSSNFFEHLPNKTALSRLVEDTHRILRPGGRLIVMGPNIACLPGKYWDYYDHHIPLTEKSVAELLSTSGYEVEESLARFVPYTVKGRLPMWPWLVRMYLLLGKITFRLFGKQFLVIARKAFNRSALAVRP